VRLVLLAALAAALAGCGGGSSGGAAPPAPADVAARLKRELTRRYLSVRWVTCVPRSERVAGAPVFRCNVNFGEPHIEIYCAAVVDGTLRSAAWRQSERGRQNREASARECAARLARGR
jgi:hypothetical protein